MDAVQRVRTAAAEQARLETLQRLRDADHVAEVQSLQERLRRTEQRLTDADHALAALRASAASAVRARAHTPAR